jgi:uncharacterized delta-60 repeat protein
MAVQRDGKILIGGTFTSIGGEPRSNFARLNSDGSLDTGYTLDASGDVSSIAVQADGKIFVCGDFFTLGGNAGAYLARLNVDGSFDSSFTRGNVRSREALALQADGRLLVMGVRSERVLNDPAASALSVPSPGRIQWLRGGSTPEADEVRFSLSQNSGATWSPLGLGLRIPGGWELTGLELPTNGLVRAQARVRSGESRGSSGLVETSISFAFNPADFLRFTEITRLPDGRVRVQFTGDNSVSWIGVGSTNMASPLMDWTPLGPATQISPGQFEFVDSDASDHPSRFYRIRSP